MSTQCRCCNQEVSGRTCSYCGFLNIAVLDDTAHENELNRAAEHRQVILSSLTDFSIEAFTYQWNLARSILEEKGRKKIILVNGLDSLNKIHWSEKDFGQNVDEKDKKRTVEIKYSAGGVPKSLIANLDTIRCSDFWRLGLEIHDNFSVTVYLGNVDNYTKSGPYSLELK